MSPLFSPNAYNCFLRKTGIKKKTAIAYKNIGEKKKNATAAPKFFSGLLLGYNSGREKIFFWTDLEL